MKQNEDQMTPSPTKKIVAVLNDLMFQVKIQEAAKRAGVEAVFVRTQQEALAQAKEHPAMIILDLNNSMAEPLETIERLKGDVETSGIKLVAYVSHVQTDLRRAAQEKGCDLVVARSAFVQNLPVILAGQADLTS